MKIGFIWPEEDQSNELMTGHTEAIDDGATHSSGGWLTWIMIVMSHFLMVYGGIALVKDILH